MVSDTQYKKRGEVHIETHLIVNATGPSSLSSRHYLLN